MLISTSSFGQKQTLSIPLTTKFDESAMKITNINARAAFLACLCFLCCAGLMLSNKQYVTALVVLGAASIWGVVAYKNRVSKR